MAKNKVSLGKVLAFRRALEITDARMYQIIDGKEVAIEWYEHTMRTTKAFDTKNASGGKSGELSTNKNDKSYNISTVHNAKLDANSNKMIVSCDISFLPIYVVPEMAESAELKAMITRKNQELIEDGETLTKISQYYAYNILSGAWLWRNRDAASKISISAKGLNIEEVTIENAEFMPVYAVLTKTQRELGIKEPLEQYQDKISYLANLIEQRLKGNGLPMPITITAKLQMNSGAQVYPSQIFNNDNSDKVGRRLYCVPSNGKSTKAVGITAEKINNALRRFDLLSDKDGNEYVLAIEPNGSDITTGESLRQNEKRLISVYSNYLFNNEASQEEKIFIVASLIRGGLFGESA